MWIGLVGLREVAKKVALEFISCSNSSRLGPIILWRCAGEVPARLVSARELRPSPTGSAPISKTTGMFVVAAFVLSPTAFDSHVPHTQLCSNLGGTRRDARERVGGTAA